MCYQLWQGEAICIAASSVFPGKVQGDVLLLEPKPTGLIFSHCYGLTWESSLLVVVPVRLVVLHRSLRCTVYLVCF